ncbi:long-chain fatty acid--CoA ligase [Rhodococcus sp. IEGM 1307]|uniref:long-chain-fatty-acid--CoA ligase n=1 Tax=Rhodococcus sp. IEGM 1307 TaxID=3047091 RepID=UPI0024B7D911|nr:long-chain fatty acid--CoA ligase [Rhodococcus sp. IEGM 1307]MDI9974129.1 long-chain fatty acid--CoA ligase [Rhodococcus sp. IEGM 1307]
MLNLSVLLEDSVRRYPDRDALVLREQRQSYAELNRQANKIANLLVARGVKPGDKVALSCPNLIEFPTVYYGILKAGAVVVPLNILLKGREVAYHLNDSQARAYFCFEGGPDLPIGEYGHDGFRDAHGCTDMFLLTADPHAPSPIAGVETAAQAIAGMSGEFETVVRQPTDTAVILYTSGTTGQPKGAELTHSNMVLNALSANRLLDSTPTQLDVCLVTLPLFHSFGQTISMNSALCVGSTLVLIPRFEAAAALAVMERENVTVFAGVPTMYWALLGALEGRNADADVDKISRNMRKAISGGAALPVEILTQFKTKFGVQILEGYGLSETSPLALFSDPEQDPRPGSIGCPVWGVEARLVDQNWNTISGEGQVGEIALRGHNVMKGYYNRPDATNEVIDNGWFRTGDLARVDEDGFYYIVDRAKDLIVRGGFNVYPREIEEVLMTHASVSLAAVVGLPDERHGEEVKAFVILAPSAQVTEDELITWSKAQMASYKYPRRIEFVAALPMTATGKILKRELVRVEAAH